MKGSEIIEGNAYTDEVNPPLLVSLIEKDEVTYVPWDGSAPRATKEDLAAFAARMKKLVPIPFHRAREIMRQHGRG